MAEFLRYLTVALRRRGYHGERLARDLESGTLVFNRQQEEHLYRILQDADQDVQRQKNRAHRFGR